MEPKYTDHELRSMANELRHPPLHPFALGKAASMLIWAADVIEAARIALKPTSSDD